MNEELSRELKVVSEVANKLDTLASEVTDLRATCRESLRLDRKLDINQSQAIDALATRIAQKLELGEYDQPGVQLVISEFLLRNRLELSPISSGTEAQG